MADQEGTPLVPPEMENQETLDHLPTNEEVLAQEQEGDNKEDGDEGADTTDSDGAADDSAEPAEEPAEEEPQAQVEYVDDPGAFVPGDYAFEVVTYDEEGNNGRTHHIKTLEDWDQLLESSPNFGTGAAMLKAERAAQRMDRGIERDRQAYEAKKAEYDEAVKAQQESDSRTMQWQNELDYLVSRGDLPPMPHEYHVSRADWSNPTVAKQPAVAAQKELLAFFRSENQARIKAGLAPMTSLLDAYQGMENKRLKQSRAETNQATRQVKREQAAKVSGSAPRPATAAPRGIAVGRIGALK